jgi:predicted dehydrogenase
VSKLSASIPVSPKVSSKTRSVPARLQVALIGVGKYALKHLELLEGNSTVKLVGLCDVSQPSLSRAKAAHPQLVNGATSYSDHRQLLEVERPDAVIICSPHRDHYQQVADSLDAGAHILVEKPLVNSSTQAQEILCKARKAGVVVGIAYQRHAIGALRFIHEGIRDGRWGKVKSICAYQQEAWKDATAGTWRHQPEISGGGYLHDGGSHLVDLVLWTTGLKPKSVSAVQDYADAPVDVSTVMNVRFEGGALGNLSIMGDIPGWSQSLIIGCEEARIAYSTDTGVAVHSRDGATHRVPQHEMPPDTDMVNNFLNAIQHGEPILAPLECGLAVMRLTEAVMESATSQSAAVAV